jgi:hypothetical protein
VPRKIALEEDAVIESNRKKRSKKKNEKKTSESEMRG